MGEVYFIHLKRKYLLIPIIILLSILLIVITWRFYQQTKNESAIPVAFMKGNENEKKIALTFNISWGEEKVFDILKVLKTEDIEATFFVSGEWAERHPQIIDQIVEEQHELGMLGYRYKNYLEQEIGQVRKDMIYAKEVFRKLGYKNTKFIRPPSGYFNEEIIVLAKQLGLDVIYWSVQTNDWENPGVENIIEQISTAKKGDIILLHASDSAKETADALKIVLPNYKQKGYSFVTVSELKNEVNVKDKLIQ